MKLNPTAERFVLHWGEMGTSWGVNRTVAQIHALLFVVGAPLNADDIAETLGVARSNVSMSLRELANWKLIRTIHLLGDRRDHFETITDVWELFRVVVSQRKEREFDPTISVLRECVGSSDFAKESPAAQVRIKETLVLMETLSTWANEMLRLEPDTLMKIMKLGAKVQGVIRAVPGGKASAAKASKKAQVNASDLRDLPEVSHESSAASALRQYK
jgi:DNA-binding transcriptional regulator GbsR (MarR family)